MHRRTTTFALLGNLLRVEALPCWLFVILLGTMTVTSAGAITEAAPALEASRTDTVSVAAGQRQEALARLEELDLLSQGLVIKAGAGATPAHNFRVETRMYRELLRQTMLADRQRPKAEQLPQELFLEMVRMSALLHAAADCKTGYVIVCPPDLMLQLKAQQAKVSQSLLMTRGKGE
jgi:hypothetical protein